MTPNYILLNDDTNCGKSGIELRYTMVTTVFASHDISGINRKNEIWTKLIDFENLPGRIPAINAIRIIERNKNLLFSEWFISLDKAPFTWIEKATMFPEVYMVKFEATSGDFDVFRGFSKIITNKHGSLSLFSQIEYELGIPVIEENLGAVLKGKMQKYIDSIVKNQSSYFSSGIKDERAEKRLNINCTIPLYLDGRLVDARIINLSSSGMLFALSRGMFTADELPERTMKIFDFTLKGHIYPVEKTTTNVSVVHRFILNNHLNDKSLMFLSSQLTATASAEDDLIRVCEVITGKQAESVITKKATV